MLINIWLLPFLIITACACKIVKIGTPIIPSMPGTNDINRTDFKKRDETNISLAVLSSHTKK